MVIANPILQQVNTERKAYIQEQCKGSTTDFDSISIGSNSVFSAKRSI